MGSSTRDLRDQYVSQVNHFMEDNLRMGYILPPDASQTKQDAAHSSIGK